MLFHYQHHCTVVAVLIVESWCRGASSFSIPMSRTKETVNEFTLWGQPLNQDLNLRRFDPYKLGLTPYKETKLPNTETLQHNTTGNTVESSLQLDRNKTSFTTNATNYEPLSYLHLLQLPDRIQTAAYSQNSTKPKKFNKPLFIDEWMMQLPSKWAAFVSEGDSKDIISISNIFAVPSSKNLNASLDVRPSNVNVVNRSSEDTNGIGTFESSDDVDAIWDDLLSKTTVQKQPQYSTASQHRTKIARLSTQPQSIFINNFNDPKKNNTSNTLKAPSDTFSQHPLLVGKDPNAAITVADLEAILRYNDYYRRSSKSRTEQELPPPDGKSAYSSSTSTTTLLSQKASKGGVAFPQPTVLSKRSVKWGATISGGLMGMLLAVSGAPNLWLVGILSGSVFGFETSQRLPDSSDVPSSDLNAMQSIVIYFGRYLARLALKLYDTFQAFFFMYKTGQLSYEYYKSYALLDKRLSIQNKIDAWNARFVEGKMAFDRWEKENEVGRKVLASLRTFWLVGEQNVRKRSGLLKRSQRYQSRYRLVQFVYDAFYTIGKLCESSFTFLFRGEVHSGIRNFFRGIIRDDVGKLTLTQAQLRGAFLSASMLSLVGALFTISPAILLVVAAGFGLVWPTWVSEMKDRTGYIFDETVARGTGKVSNVKTKGRNQPAYQRYDKNRYHYYRTSNGKKRYYRVGEPWIIAQFYKKKSLPKKGPLAWIFSYD